MEVFNNAPVRSAFTPLSEHLSRTPSSFHSSPPVLHHYSPNTTLSLRSSDLALAPIFSTLLSATSRPTNGSTHNPTQNGDNTAESDEDVNIEGVDVWIASDKLLLFSPSLSTGISLPYPAVSLHAIQRSPSPRLLLQISTESGEVFDDHDPDSTVSVVIVPCASSNPQDRNNNHPPLPAGANENPPSSLSAADTTKEMYEALSACADLHPDPTLDGDGDIAFDESSIYAAAENQPYAQIDGLPPPMPGSGGWITAENAGEFFDEEGNFRNLGGGAGTVRAREDHEQDEGEEGGANGVEEGLGDGKWRRTG